MSIVACTADRFSSHAPEPDNGGKRLAISCGGSTAIHAVLLALMMVGIDSYAGPLRLTEVPIEVVVEASPKAISPTRQSQSAPARDVVVSQPPPAAAADAQTKGATDMREIADEERQGKGAPDGTTINGVGTARSRTASVSERGEKRDSAEPDDPNKEASRRVPPQPKGLEARQKVAIAPPGPDSRPWAKDTVKDGAADKTTAKRQPIQCAANARRPTPAEGPQLQPRRGQVLGQLTKDQADRAIQINQANLDMIISPDYLDNVRVSIHVDGSREGAWSIVLLPYGLTARSGDRVEYVPYHLDPSRPCHYIPPLVSRVL
jgi:hypothetical protein